MYYYCIENEDVIKYKVTLDKEKLKELRNEIIVKCSEISHIHEETVGLPNYNDHEHTRNYKKKFLRKVDKGDFYGTTVDVYLVDYDYYEHPLLANHIRYLLNHDASIISQIINPEIEKIDEEQIIMEEQKQIIELLNNEKNNDITKQLELLKENQEKLKEYKAKKELNKNQVSVEPYYKKVLECITFNEVNKVALKNILEIQEFLSDSNSLTLDENLNKVLKLSIETDK